MQAWSVPHLDSAAANCVFLSRSGFFHRFCTNLEHDIISLPHVYTQNLSPWLCHYLSVPFSFHFYRLCLQSCFKVPGEHTSLSASRGSPRPALLANGASHHFSHPHRSSILYSDLVFSLGDSPKDFTSVL